MIPAANTSGGAYAAKGDFRTTGLVGLLARVRFAMSARGIGPRLKMASRCNSEDLDTGYRTSATSVTFGAGDTRVDRPVSEGCGFDGKTFDGLRSISARIRESARKTGALTCVGQLRRLSGYSAEDMAEATTFPFTLTFVQSGDWLLVRRDAVVTIHGKVALVRRSASACPQAAGRR